MDDDRWAARRLLSFDSASNSWTRFGKVFSQRSGQSIESPPDWIANDRTGRHKAPGPIAAMACSTDARLAAITGAGFLEVLEFQSGPDQTVASIKLDPKLKPTTIEWGQLTTRNSVAVASSSGSIQLYAFSGQSVVASRATGAGLMQPSISSLNFSSMANGNILAAASNDGQTKLWDLRQGFKRPASKFARTGDIARQVQFRPDDETRFATIYDSGMLQLWDIRKPNNCDFRINAHMQGLTLDWHPTANYLATGGRDHLVQVWNFGTESKTPEYTINTASAVGRVRWMPGDSSVANNAIITAGRSAATSNKRSTNYWLLKEPWAPIYSLETHTDSIVDIAPTSPMVFWSAAKDGLLLQHDLRFEPLVYDNFPPTIAAWSGLHAVSFNARQRAELAEETRDATPENDELFEAAAAASSSAALSTHKSAASLSIFGSSFGQQPPQSPSGYPAGYPGYAHPGSASSYFGSFGSSVSSTHFQGPLARPEQNLSALLCRIGAALKPAPIVELEFLSSKDGVMERIGGNYLYTAPPNTTLGEACRLNAAVAEAPLKTRNLWTVLGVAIDEAQQSYCASLSGRSKEIAELWLNGGDVEALIAADADGGAEATSTGTSTKLDVSPETLEHTTDEVYNWAMQNTNNTWQNSGVSFTSDLSHSEEEETRQQRRRRPSTLFHNQSSTRGNVPQLKAGSHFAEVRDGFLAHLSARQEKWQFLPMLRLFTQQAIEDGLIYTATALLLLFRVLESALDLPQSDEVIVEAIRVLRQRKKFAAAATIMQISSVWQDHMGQPETQVDLACQHCKASLSENTAFFVKEHTATGYWYCGRCKGMQGACSLCNIPVKGLGIAVLACGHKCHHKCWQEWLAMKIDLCPAGCGQPL